MDKSPFPIVAGLGLALVMIAGSQKKKPAQAGPLPWGQGIADPLITRWLDRIAAGALDIFDGMSPAILDRLLAGPLLNPQQRIIVERLRRR